MNRSKSETNSTYGQNREQLSGRNVFQERRADEAESQKDHECDDLMVRRRCIVHAELFFSVLNNKSPDHDLSPHIKHLGKHTTYVARVLHQSAKRRRELKVLTIVGRGLRHLFDQEDNQSGKDDKPKRHISRRNKTQIMFLQRLKLHLLKGGDFSFAKLTQRFIDRNIRSTNTQKLGRLSLDLWQFHLFIG